MVSTVLGRGTAAIAIAGITSDRDNPARPWRRKARADLYAPHRVDGDPMSEGRNLFRTICIDQRGYSPAVQPSARAASSLN